MTAKLAFQADETEQKPSAISVLNRILTTAPEARDVISDALDKAIAEDEAMQPSLLNALHPKNIGETFRTGISSLMVVFESYTSRNPRPMPLVAANANVEPDALLWGVLANYCAKNPDLLDKIYFSQAEMSKLEKLMDAKPIAKGEEYAFKAG